MQNKHLINLPLLHYDIYTMGHDNNKRISRTINYYVNANLTYTLIFIYIIFSYNVYNMAGTYLMLLKFKFKSKNNFVQ